MQVSFKLTANQIGYLAGLFERYESVTPAQFQIESRQSKLLTSICVEIADKFVSKFKKVSRSQDIFNQKKKYKMTLPYYQTHAVYMLVMKYKAVESDSYRKTMAELITINLEPKLL